MSVLTDQVSTPKHARFPSNLDSGSHRPPREFQKSRSRDFKNLPQLSILAICIRSGDQWGVPFDRNWVAKQASGWIENGTFNKPITGCDAWKARFKAIDSFFRGAVLLLVDLVKYVYAKITRKSSAEIEAARTHLRAQWHGVCLSGVATISPHRAREKYNDYWNDRQENINRPAEIATILLVC